MTAPRGELLDALDARRPVVVHHDYDGTPCALVGTVVCVDRSHVSIALERDITRSVPISAIKTVRILDADA